MYLQIIGHNFRPILLKFSTIMFISALAWTNSSAQKKPNDISPSWGVGGIASTILNLRNLRAQSSTFVIPFYLLRNYIQNFSKM